MTTDPRARARAGAKPQRALAAETVRERLRRRVLRHVVFPVVANVTRRASVRDLAALRRLEHADPAEVRAGQCRKVRALLRWAYDTVPYYRRAMDDAGVAPDSVRDISDLARLPVLRKRDVQAFAADLVSRGAAPDLMEAATTSGTTGTPLHFYRDRRASPLGQASWWHALGWVGVHPTDSMFFLTLPMTYSGRNRSGGVWHRLVGTNHVAMDRLVARDGPEVLDALERARPRLIAGYPSALHLLAQMVLEDGRRVEARPHLRAIMYHAEQMGDDTRELVKRAFGVPIVSRYGAMEFCGMIAYTCLQGGWHLNANGFIVEVVSGGYGDRIGTPCDYGRLLITDLRNYVMPFIRYEIGDIARTTSASGEGGASAGVDARLVSASACACGRTMPLLGGIEGRASEYLVTPTGRCVPALLVQRGMKLHAQIALFWEYQFRQRTHDLLEVFVVPKDVYGEAQAAELSRHLEAYLGNEVRVLVYSVDSIPREPSGKRPILKSSLNPFDRSAAHCAMQGPSVPSVQRRAPQDLAEQ